MSNQLAIRSTELDPDFAEVYAEEEPRRVSGSSHSQSAKIDSPPENKAEDQFLAFSEMARKHQSESVDRKSLSGFDQVEHDVTRAVKLGWEFLTRPL